MTRVAGQLSHALAMLSSGKYSQIATDLPLQYLLQFPRCVGFN
jgi:hypothetical protein